MRRLAVVKPFDYQIGDIKLNISAIVALRDADIAENMKGPRVLRSLNDLRYLDVDKF